jgi:hypothetical protein
MNPDIHHDDCLSVPTPSAGTAGQLGQNSGTPVGQGWDSTVPSTSKPKAAFGTLKALANKVLSATVPTIPLPTNETVGHPAEIVRHQRDTSGTEVSQTVGQQTLPTGQSFDASMVELQDSMKRLDAMRLSVAVFADGAMRIITDGAGGQVWRAGGTVYSPGEMYAYIQLSPEERKLFRQMKGIQ